MITIRRLLEEDGHQALTIPTIHLNGTSKGALIEGYQKARSAIREAMDALIECRPNGRDYYPQGEDAISIADREHQDRIDYLFVVEKELEYLIHQIDERYPDRRETREEQKALCSSSPRP